MTDEPPTWAALAQAADEEPWPTATLAPAARLRAVAAGLPGTVVEERVLDAPFERVWGFIADLERSVPTFDRDVARLRVTSRRGTHLQARATSSWRHGSLPVNFEVDLEPGWCWMVSRPRLYVVGMAAARLPGDPERTHYLHMEGVPFAGRVLGPVARATRVRHRRHVASDVDGIERALASEP
jgi:hypothetical protein